MKTVNEMKHANSVTAKALIFDGKPAGRIIANWSDNPSGSTCSASVIVWLGPLSEYSENGKELNYANIGKAGGYGYDKLSQAVWQCLVRAGVPVKEVKPGNGLTNQEFEAWGYIVADIL